MPTSSSAPAPNWRSAGCRCCCSSRATRRCSRASQATSLPPTIVRKLDVPGQLDRSQGDVHAAGNPHIQTDPRNIAQVATALGARLQQVDPAHAGHYAQRQADFAQRWQQAIAALDGAGRAAEGRAGGLAAQGLRLPVRLARPEGSRGARAQARRRAHRIAPAGGAGRAEGRAGAHGAVRGLPGPASVRVAQQERRHSGA